MQGNPAANNVKWGLRALAVILVPLTASFPQVCCIGPLHMRGACTLTLSFDQGVFVYWITSNTFSFFQTIGTSVVFAAF